MHYVIGDVHGCFDEMQRLIQKIEEKDPDAVLIFVGDFVDRGPKVMETLQWAMENITPDGKYQSVIGNHEDMLIGWYQEKFLKWYNHPKRFFLKRPMPPTYYDFSRVIREKGMDTPGQLEPIMDFFRSMPPFKKLRIGEIDYVIVHAWYDFDLKEEDPEQRELNIWSRDYSDHGQENTIIVHGHTPTLSEEYCSDDVRPGMIDFDLNSINVDGGAVFLYQGNCTDKLRLLCGICLETLEEFYSDTPEENFARMAEWEGLSEEMMKSYQRLYEQKYLNGYEETNKKKLLKMVAQETEEEELPDSGEQEAAEAEE